MRHASLPSRGAAGLLAGLLLGPWLVPAAGGGAGGADGTDGVDHVLPPVPRSVVVRAGGPWALPTVQAHVDEVLDHVAPVNRGRLADMEVRVHVVPRHRDITDVGPWRHLRGRPVHDGDAGDPYPEARTYDEVRGLGPPDCVAGPLDIGIGEEQMATFAGGRHPSPHPHDLGRNLVHELGHAVECGLTDGQRDALARSFRRARRRFPHGIVGAHPAYTVSSVREYFAEGTVAWFGAGEGGNYQRGWLAAHDPDLHGVLSEVFSVPPLAPTCGGRRATVVLATGGAPFTGTPGPDVVAGSPGGDVVNGGGGADVICGRGGDDVLYGGYGADRLLGGRGDDGLQGGAGDLCRPDPGDRPRPCRRR